MWKILKIVSMINDWEFYLFGRITSARVMMEVGYSKGFAFVCFTLSEETNKAIMAIHRRIGVTKPPYMAIAQSKGEHQAILTKIYMEWMVVMRAGGNLIVSQGNISISK